jgi:molybdenum cofactor biosynthesis enzyme MoaA
MQFDPTTFCAAPWFQIRNENLGTFKVCCDIRHRLTDFQGQTEFSWPQHTVEEFANSNYVQYLRQNLSQGQRLPECERCWQAEARGQRSQRQTVNNSCTRNHEHEIEHTWIGSFMKQQQDWKTDLLISADIKLTNLCNFACVMCNSDDSSQIYSAWLQDIEHSAVQMRIAGQQDRFHRIKTVIRQRPNHELLRDMLARKPRYIKLLGGEPLLDHAVLSMLADVDVHQKSQTAVTFVTNGSQDLNAVRDQLAGYQSVDFVVSLDGVGLVQDFIRQGSDWRSIETNIDRYLSQHPGCLSIHHVSQALNVHVLGELAQWCDCRNIVLDVAYLANPDFMSYDAIPPALRQRALDILQSCHVTTETARVRDRLNMAQWRPELTGKLATYLDWYDKHGMRHKVLPEWTPYF